LILDRLDGGRGSRFDQATALIRRAPLRWFEGDSHRDSDSALESGWFLGADECARTVAAFAGLPVLDGGAFGRRWPVLGDARGWLAPGLPVTVGDQPTTGVDGEYRRLEGNIWREAGGVEALVLKTAVDREPPGSPFDLLWFGDAERFVVRAGRLEIENLFALFRAPAAYTLLDRLLIRARSAGTDIVSNITFADPTTAPTVEVRRPAELSADDRWRDPVLFLGMRAGVENPRRTGDTIAANVSGGTRVAFRATDGPLGWRLDLAEGRFPFNALRLAREGSVLVLSATLDAALDVTAAGVRARLAFDLRSDLVALG
jgi:hypothetical protein